MKIRVTAVERPESFNPWGEMDYMLNRACELEVVEDTGMAYVVECLYFSTTWRVNKSYAEVVEEPTYKFPENLRKGDDIDWNTIDPEAIVMHLYEDDQPSIFKIVDGKWYFKFHVQAEWTLCNSNLTAIPDTVEIVFRGERQSVAVKTGWFFNPNADDPRILYVFRKDADSWLLAGWPVTHAYMSEHYNVSELIPMEEWLKIYKNKD